MTAPSQTAGGEQPGASLPRRADRGQVVLDESFMVHHAARSLVISAFVHTMTLLAAWMAAVDGTEWTLVVALYAINATAVLHLARRSPGSGLVPFGTLGDSRFVLALLALVLAAAYQPAAATATLPFWMMLTASALCGQADGAWTAAIMRHGHVSFRQALVLTARRIGVRKSGMVQFMAGRPAP